MDFRLASDYKPKGDQPNAIEELTRGIYAGEKHQVLLGVTGSGKTYTMAKVIEQLNRPAIVLPNSRFGHNSRQALSHRIQVFGLNCFSFHFEYTGIVFDS